MTETAQSTDTRRRPAPVLLGLVAVMLIVSAAGAAQRVVLGEYFTNQY